jgi:predicted Zn-dependent protease
MTRIAPMLVPAEGFLELGLHHEAWEELEKLPDAARAHPDVLLLRLDILLGMERWQDAVTLGAGCCMNWRTHDVFFLRTADALMHLRDWGNALVLLKSAPESLHVKPEYHFAIARCAARLGLVSDAKAALQECFSLDKGYRQRALDEHDLQAFWESFR